MTASGRILLLAAWAYGVTERISISVPVVPVRVAHFSCCGSGREAENHCFLYTFPSLLLVGPGGPKVHEGAIPRWA